MDVAADASFTRMPTFEWTARERHESLLPKRFLLGERGQSVVGMWVDTVSASTAVEAARAGANGRGFAVVAQEVRALAERSSSAAKEIDALIKGITTEVDLSSVAVNRAGSTIVDLIGAVNGVSQLVELIASASSEQSVGIDQVNAAVSTMDQMTQKNAAFAQDGVEAGSALEAQAQYLRSAVRAFRL